MGPKICRRFCKYERAGPMTKRIRRDNSVWNEQSKENADACGDEDVKEESKSGEPNDDRWNGTIDLPEAPREPKSQEEQCTLKNQWQ